MINTDLINHLKPFLGPVRYFCLDSREIKPSEFESGAGACFLAAPSAEQGPEAEGGMAYIPDAIARGAVLILSHRPIQVQDHAQVPVVHIPDWFENIGPILEFFFQTQALLKQAKAQVFGVTGTNGKTTVSQLIAQFWGRANCLIVGTLGVGFFGNLKSLGCTSPDAAKTHQLIH
ncbi:MAG: Mur ligase family protein, partial [Gammaproteobacteria bacterium]